MNNLVPFIPLLPLIGFIVNGVFGHRLPKSVVGILGSSTLLGSLILTVFCFNQVASVGPLTLSLYTFLGVDNLQLGFGFLVDALSVWMMLIITGVGFLIHVYSVGYMQEDAGFHRFFAYLNLFVCAMLLLVMGDNFMVLFFGWEGVGLCSYLLIGFWYDNVPFGLAARKAFIMNRVGDLGLLLGMFLLYRTFGSLNYAEVFAQLDLLKADPVLAASICLLLFVGAMGKSAQIPLYTWLPDAMAGPTPVSALIHAATMVTAGIYLVARCNGLYSLSAHAQEVIAIIGLATALFSAVIALRQNDIKKVLAYSTVSQLGLMFMALGMGAYTAAMFHVTTHAFFKALLFLSAGSVIHGMGGEQDIRKMGGLRRHMPITFWVFSVGTLAISGFPFLSGFFSKDEIFAFTYAHGGAAWWILASLGALLTAVYMCRLWYVTFFGTFRGTTDQEHHLHESPLVMTIPLMALAFLSVVGGLLNTPHLFHFGEAQWLSHWMAGNGILGVPVIPVQVMHLDHQTEWMLMAITTTVALLVLVLLYRVYRSPRNLPVEDAAQGRLSRMIAGKFYIDELYEFLFVRTTERLSRILHYYADIWAIDGLVQLVGSGVEKMGGQFRRLQNGNTAFYLVGMVLGVVGLMLTVYIL